MAWCILSFMAWRNLSFMAWCILHCVARLAKIPHPVPLCARRCLLGSCPPAPCCVMCERLRPIWARGRRMVGCHFHDMWRLVRGAHIRRRYRYPGVFLPVHITLQVWKSARVKGERLQSDCRGCSKRKRIKVHAAADAAITRRAAARTCHFKACYSRAT
jgi:hypothetical protein